MTRSKDEWLNMFKEFDDIQSDNIKELHELDAGTCAMWYVVERLEGILQQENVQKMYTEILGFYGECKYNVGINTANAIRDRQESI